MASGVDWFEVLSENFMQTGGRPLITNSDVAEPNRPVTMIKQRTRDYADRIREIQNPGILGG